jgi:hypothetical protein
MPLRENPAAMRTVRDLILVICAVISTACLVYLAYIATNLHFTVLTPAEMSAAPEDQR